MGFTTLREFQPRKGIGLEQDVFEQTVMAFELTLKAI